MAVMQRRRHMEWPVLLDGRQYSTGFLVGIQARHGENGTRVGGEVKAGHTSARYFPPQDE